LPPVPRNECAAAAGPDYWNDLRIALAAVGNKSRSLFTTIQQAPQNLPTAALRDR
jgi:hypothetical protein